MERQPKKEQQPKKAILYPDTKNKSYRVNVRPTGWDDACKLWYGKIKDLALAQRIADIALFLTGNEPAHKTDTYMEILPVDNDDLQSFRTREEFLDYVRSIAKGNENLAKRMEFKDCLNKIMKTVKHGYEERDKEVGKAMEKPNPLVTIRSNSLFPPRLPAAAVAAASSSGSEGLCEDEMEVVDQLTDPESNRLSDDMDEDAKDPLADVPTASKANVGDHVRTKVSGKGECQAMDEGVHNEDLLGMIAGEHQSSGSLLEYRMPIPGVMMDKGDEDLVFVPYDNISLFKPNQDDGGLFTYRL